MPEQSATHSRTSHQLSWVFAALAALATALALYFAYEAHEARAKAVSSASELSAKKRELAELREREGAGLANAMNATVTPPRPMRPKARFDDPAPSPSPNGASVAHEVFRSPAIREMNRQARLRMLRPIYDPLLTQLNLSPEQRDRFYDLQLAVDDPGAMLQKLPSEAGTPDERAQIEAQIQQIRDSALSQIQGMLGPGEYRLYQSYRNTQSDRMLVEQFRQQFDSSSTQMTDWQSAQLRDALIQARTQYPPVSDDFATSDQAALAQAAQFLTPEQLNAFRDYLHTQEEMRREVQKLNPPGQ